VKPEKDIRIVMDRIWEEWCDYGGGTPYYILPSNARAEGVFTVEEFEKTFRELNPKWDGQKRWVFRFHVIEVQKMIMDNIWEDMAVIYREMSLTEKEILKRIICTMTKVIEWKNNLDECDEK
jgi:hypothetical protein